jgi:UDP-2,3-diacylglucosamine pyrophosphatase LpxH
MAFLLPRFVLRRLGPDRYERQIRDALERAWERSEERRVDVRALRAVAFSDHHRGKGDGADDFRRCEEGYSAALGWYLEQKPEYELWLLGDVEELWENRPGKVMERYGDVLALERQFAPRLLRLYGNHDMAWRRTKNVTKHFGDGINVTEGLRLVLTDDGEELGTLFLAHGHQGTFDSGNFLFVPISRFFVRAVWGTLQRSFGFASTSPANDAVLRAEHDRAMAAWADTPDTGRALVAGHTHHPVFPGTLPPDRDKALEEAERAYQDALSSGSGVDEARAARELAAARKRRSEPHDPVKLKRSCYFNTGCCSFGDGDVTALEFSDGEVRLVRWLEDSGRAVPQQLTPPLELRTVFSA